MATKKSRLPISFGQITKLPPERIGQLYKIANQLFVAYSQGNHSEWLEIINQQNRTLTKYEAGFISGLLATTTINGDFRGAQWR